MRHDGIRKITWQTLQLIISSKNQWMLKLYMKAWWEIRDFNNPKVSQDTYSLQRVNFSREKNWPTPPYKYDQSEHQQQWDKDITSWEDTMSLRWSSPNA